MSPPLIHLIPSEINSKPFTFNECLRKSRKRSGYHTFTLLFRVEFESLDIATQSELLFNETTTAESITSRANIRKLANKHWRTLSSEKKAAWNCRAHRLNTRPQNDGFFTELPSSLSGNLFVSDPMKQHVIESLSHEFISFTAFLRNAILRRPSKLQSQDKQERSYKFGKEKFLLLSQIYCTYHLTHLLNFTLFGTNYNKLLQHEIVEQSDKLVIVHICSYARLQSVLTMNGLNGACHFLNEDDYEVVWDAAAKVWLRDRDGCECVGYVLDEANDEIEVMIDDGEQTRVKLTRPNYDRRVGRYEFMTEASSSRKPESFVVMQYAPVLQMKLHKSGKLYVVLNRIEFEINTSNIDAFDDNNVTVEAKHIINVNTPFDM